MAVQSGRKTKRGGSFILLVGDEGAILVQMQGKEVTRRLFAQSSDPLHTRAFEEALNSSPKSPVTLLVDLTDQSYVRQTLPPVSALSINKIVRRRLDKDFAPDDIKGYRILGREKTGRKDWTYLMVSLANPPALQKWIGFAVERSNPFKGIGLLPLESQPLMLAINKALSNKKESSKPLEWQILVSHQKVGGFRQVVLRNGKLVFTRMAQVVGEALPDVIAGNIEQEMLNTLEYLKRMGLSDLSTLSVAIIAAQDIRSVLDPKNIRSGEYHFFTPEEMAEMLGLTNAAQEEDRFGDVVLSAFVLRRGKLILPLHTPYTQKLIGYGRAIMGARAAAAVAALALFGWAGMSGYDIYTAKDHIQQMAVDERGVRKNMDEIKDKAKNLPKQIDLFTDVMTLSRMFDRHLYDPQFIVKSFSESLQGDAQVASFHWSVNDPLSVSHADDKRQLTAELGLHLLTSHEPKERYIAAAHDLVERIKKSSPQFAVTTTEMPALLSDTTELKTTIGDNGNNAATAGANLVENITVTLHGPIAPTDPNAANAPPGGLKPSPMSPHP